jgi:thioredoxin 2
MTSHPGTSPDAAVGRHATVACPFCATLNRVDLARLADRPRCGECHRPILLDRPVAVTDASFERVIGGTEVPVVVDCYADWCVPCKMMAPILDEFARDRSGEVLVTKLDTDRNPATAERLGIRAIPTLVVFQQGRETGRQMGVLARPQLDTLVDAARRS